MVKEKVLFADSNGNSLCEEINPKTGRKRWFGRNADNKIVNQVGLAKLIKLYQMSSGKKIEPVSMRAKNMDRMFMSRGNGEVQGLPRVF